MATYPMGEEGPHVGYHLHRVNGAGGPMDPRPGPSWKKFLILDPQLLRLTRRLLAAFRFDLIHAHHYEGLIAALLARHPHHRRLPVLFDAHTLLGSELPHYRLLIPPRVVRWTGSITDRTLPRRADHVIVVTERMRRWFMESALLTSEGLSLIPNGVEHEHFSNSVEGRHAPSSRVSGAPLLMFAGTLAEYQGIDALLKAFAMLHVDRPEVRLRLVTNTVPAPSLTDLRDQDLIDAVEVVSADYDELPKHLADADVLVNPRMDCDGIPQKLLNYMAAGRPIVSFAGSASALVADKTGLVVPDGDLEGFAAAIRRLLDEPALGAKLGAAARRNAERSYSWRRVAREVEAAYQAMLARSSVS